MLPEPPDGYQDELRARDLLNRFVNGGQYEGLVALPKRVEPSVVDDFVRVTLDRQELRERQVARCGELMRFYDLRGRAGQVPRLLDRGEKDAALFQRSMAAVAILGDLGDDALQAQAADYYRHLAGHRLAAEFRPRLVDLFFHLPEPADPKWISEPFEARAKALEPKIDADEDAAVEYYALRDLLDDRLQRVLKARQRKHEILKLADPKRRRVELIRCYVRLEKNAYVDLRTWAMMILQRECNATKPEELAERFGHALDLIRSEATRRRLTGGDLDDLKAYVTSCARGVEFYRGTLTEEQADYAGQHHKKEQNDLLYWEPEESKAATQAVP
jgi:hypothetical protein